MTTVQTGARGTIGLSNSLIVQNMMAGVSLLESNDKPITTVLNHFEKVAPTETPEPQHAEDELFPNVDLVNGAHTAAAATIAVDNPLFYVANDILHVPRTGENMRVTSAYAGTSPIPVVRGVGSAPANLLDDEEIWILGGTSEEGARSRDAKNTLEVPYTAYAQIIRNSIDVTGTAAATRVLGNDFEDQVTKALIHHKRQMEYFFLWGTPSRTSVNSQWLRTMEGFNHRIQTNRMSINGPLGEGEFDAFLTMGFQYGNSKKMLLGSSRVVNAINRFAKSRLVVNDKADRYGVAVRMYEHTEGDVEIVKHREFKGATYGGYAMLIDWDYAVARYLRAGEGATEKYIGDRYIKRVRNIQDNDADRRKDEFFSELCIQIMNEPTMAVMMGVE